MTGPRRPPGWWDRIQQSRHRRSILGSLAVLVLLIVVIIAGAVQGGGTKSGSLDRSPVSVAGAEGPAPVLVR